MYDVGVLVVVVYVDVRYEEDTVVLCQLLNTYREITHFADLRAIPRVALDFGIARQHKGQLLYSCTR